MSPPAREGLWHPDPGRVPVTVVQGKGNRIMRSSMRTTVRAAAAVLGALALAAGAASCSGDDADQDPDAEQTVEETTEPGPQQESTAEDPDEEAGDGEYSPEDLQAAQERFIEFLQVLDDSDHEAACGFVLDPETEQPVGGEELDGCVEELGAGIDSLGIPLAPGMFDGLDPALLSASDNDDGTVTITVDAGQGATPFPLPMTTADGRWYFLDA